MSVRSRILGWSVLLLAVALAASTLAMHIFLVRQLDSRVNSELTHEIAEFRALEAQRGAGAATVASVTALLRTRTNQAVLEHDTVLIGLIGGRIVAISQDSSAATIGVGRAQLTSWSGIAAPVGGIAQLAAGPARYLAVPARSGTVAAGAPVRGVFVAAVLTGQGQAGITRVTRLQAEVGAIALLLGSALAWFAAGRVLRPVRDTTELARRITDTDIAGRIPSHGQNEMSELAHTLNRMLDRLEAALTTQRRFLADAGHELRTPITIIQGNLDTLAVASDEDTATLAIVTDELTRMTRLVDELTLLASSERPDFLRPVPTDLAALTTVLAAKARVLDSLDEGRFLLTSTATGTATLDPQRITQAVMQLAANAVAHTPPGTRVDIGSVIAGPRLEFLVSDSGPGTLPQFRDRVFERFARLDMRRGEGTGLGLSIVAAISSAHDGTVKLADRAGGLDCGADDYLSKPFRLAELLARVRARLRPAPAREETVLRNGDLQLDLRTRQAQAEGRTIDLSAREFALAEVFLRHPGQVLSREQLLSHVWGYDYDPGSNVVEVYVRYLRNKLGPDRIATIRGAGYRLIRDPLA